MLHTVYSNSYEILRAYLIHSLGTHALSSPFEPVRIISGSRLINNELMLSLAKEHNICAGIDFWTTNNWFRNYLGFGLSEGGQSQKFIWLLWQLLDDDFINEHPRLKKYFEQREKLIDRDLLRYDFARDLSSLFEKYVNYRFDWVFKWAFPQEHSQTVTTLSAIEQKQNEKEQAALEASADFEWQRALWKKIGDQTELTARRTLNMFGDLDSLKNKTTLEPQEIHFFVPSNVSPLMLPVIKLLSEDKNHHVYAYLLNPCQSYWFGSYDHAQSTVGDYLRKNAASTRAMINRFNDFATEEALNEKLHPKPPVNILTQESLQHLKLTTQSEIERTDLSPNSDSLLSCFQRAILLDDAGELPSSLSAKDRSIRFIKAPTTTREVENLVEVIHALFQDPSLPNLKADDILVVCPDIEATAPIIDATFSTLPETRRIDYKIIGRNAIDENMTVRALIELGRLLMTPMTINQLEAWLELPFVTNNLHLSLEDLNIIRDWLVSAGFREGLNAEHLQNTRHIELVGADNTPHEALDGTLERALERLSWGYVLDGTEKNGFNDILPIRNGTNTRFNTVTSEKRIFQTLLTLESKLKQAHRLYLNLGSRTSFDEMTAWGNALIELFFTQSDVSEKIALQSSLRSVNLRNTSENEKGEIDASFSDQLLVSPAVYWRALEDTLGEESTRQTLSGAITFAPIKQLRHIPFRVILAFGLNENSSFPGTQHFQEYDLMGKDELKRQDDRDSRSDNRNAFLNLILSARDRLYCSWCIGTDQKNPANPSTVVTDFMNFLASNTTDATQFLAPITAQLPLSPVSPKNFQSDETHYWKSVNGSICESLKLALKTHFQDNEPPIVTGPLNVERFGKELNIEELISFFKSPPDWLEKQLMIRDYDETSIEEVPLIAPRDNLTMALLSKQWLEAFDEGLDSMSVNDSLDRNPLIGAVNTRTVIHREAINKRFEAWTAQKEFLSEACPHHFEHLSIDIETLNQADNDFKIKSVYFEKLIARNVTLWSSGEDDHKTLYHCEICLSKSALKRALLRVMLLNVLLDKPVGLKAYALTLSDWVDPTPPEKTLSKNTFKAWLEVMEGAIAEVTYIDKRAPSNPMYDTQSPSILWRGSDLNKAKALAQKMYRDFDDCIKPWTQDK